MEDEDDPMNDYLENIRKVNDEQKQKDREFRKKHRGRVLKENPVLRYGGNMLAYFEL